jgi:DNA-binding NarL/FixJ family response regulator
MEGGEMIKVLIADDHHLVRQGIRALLENESDIEVVGEAQDGREVLELTQNLEPDVVVLDINMPRLDGIETAERLREQGSKAQIIILSMYSDESLVRKAFRKGVKGYVLKRSVTEELLEAVDAASKREMYISQEIETSLDIETVRLITETGDLNPFDTLTTREKDVFKLVAEGMTNNAIAFELGISSKTVEKHRASLMEKMSIDDMAGLVREAIKHGLIFIEGS